MPTINRVFLAGNLTRDPQTRFLPGDKAVASFGIAINRKFKDRSGETKEDVTFIDVEAWGRTAELVGQYLMKGRGCFIEGRLKMDQWEDKKDGSKRSKLVVVADAVHFLGGKRGGEQGENGEQAAPDAAPAERPASSNTQDEPPF
jgi:single-strand DNA-binding protein